MTEKPRKTHFQRDNLPVSACGLYHPSMVSFTPEGVTCSVCLKWLKRCWDRINKKSE